MKEKDDTPDNKFPDIGQHLSGLTKTFLDKIGQTGALPSSVEEREAQRQQREERRAKMLKELGRELPAVSDAFEKSYEEVQRLKAARQANPVSLPATPDFAQSLSSRVLGAAKTLKDKLSEKMGELAVSPVEPDTVVSTPASPVVPDRADTPLTVSPELIARMTRLLEAMTGTPMNVDATQPWLALDKLSAGIRTAWVGAISKGAAAQVDGHRWLNEWEKIVKDVASSAPSWPSPQAQSWGQWAAKGLVEIEGLRPWFAVAVDNGVIPSVVLVVPTAFKNKGVIPSAPATVPAQLTDELQMCADYWESMQNKNGKFHWKNTPAKHAFDECKNRLEGWKAGSEAEKKWKDDALERYAILDGRLTLRALPQPSPSTRPGLKK